MRRIEEGIHLNPMSSEGGCGCAKQDLLALLLMLSLFGDVEVLARLLEGGHWGNFVYCRIVSGLEGHILVATHQIPTPIGGQYW